MSFREDALKERIEAVRPKLAKAREIAEKAESENRAMTAEEQKTFDEIMAKGREVADAVKQKRHDEEVFAFAKDLSDNVIGDLDGSPTSSKSQRLSFKGMGSQVAKQMLPDGIKSLAPSGSAVVGQEMRSDPVALGQPALSLLDVIPVVAHALIRRDRQILLSLRLETRSGTNRCGRSPATRPRRRSVASSPKPLRCKHSRSRWTISTPTRGCSTVRTAP